MRYINLRLLTYSLTHVVVTYIVEWTSRGRIAVESQL